MTLAPNESWYQIKHPEQIDSPVLVLYKQNVLHNINTLIAMVDDINKLRPHVKTHKCGEVAKLNIAAGITKFKCATIAEAEMLAMSGATDVLLAYQPTTVKLQRFISLIKKYPATAFSCLVDNLETASLISREGKKNNLNIAVFIDINVGMNRTGILPDQNALKLYEHLKGLDNCTLKGLHAYDGHIYESEIVERKQIWENAFSDLFVLFNQLREKNNSLILVAGGTPTFPFNAKLPHTECSPGTFIFWDKDYGDAYKEQPFLHAAVIISRVVSIINENHVCIDLGHKAISSEYALNKRVFFLNFPEAKPVSHSEEHMVIAIPQNYNLKIGDVLYALPMHICPSVAVYASAPVIEHGNIVDEWQIIARNRSITV